MFWTGVCVYLGFGLLCTFIGPAAAGLREEITSLHAGRQHPLWKRWAFAAVIGCGIIFLWPVLVLSAVGSPRVSSRRKLREVREFAEAVHEHRSRGVDADELPNVYGPFGSLTNPIPTQSIVGSQIYLERLCGPNGLKIGYTRLGSFASPVTEGLVDGYRIIDDAGITIAALFLAPYNKRNSEKAPPGFGLLDEKNAGSTDLPREGPSARNVLKVKPDHQDGEVDRPSSSTARSTSSGAKEQQDSGLSDARKEPDFAELELAASAGDLDAQYELGLRYVYGRDVKRNSVVGEKWLTLAAQGRHTEAQLTLGTLHLQGELLDKGIQQARHWLSQAAGAGHQEAIAKLLSIEPDLGGSYQPSASFGPAARRIYRTLPEQPNRKKSASRLEDGAWTEAGRRSPSSRPQFLTDTWDNADAVNRRYHRMGIRRGEMLRELAAEVLRERLEHGFHGLDEQLEVAREMALSRRYTLAGEVAGMGDALDGADPLFDERRAAFVEGVLAGIERPPDEH